MEARLADVDDAVLAELVAVAALDAEPEEVTPPSLGNGWCEARLAWLRDYHRDRRGGLEGPLAEATWAILLDGAVVGAVRLARREQGVLEIGIWLCRSARGSGAAAAALGAVIEVARVAGATTVLAVTTPENRRALRLLRAQGFTIAP